jgi:hypothetical protein
MNAVNPVCVTAAPVKLSALPEGGTFAGQGVSGDTLYPSVAGAGNITVTYTYNDQVNGCPGIANQLVTIHALPVVNLTDETVCGNLVVNYDATISNPGSYLWSPGGATTAEIQIDTIGKGLGTHVYAVTVTDGNGCVTIADASVSFYDCTGIEELPDSDLIELYPNPSTGQFAIRSQSIPSGKYDLIVFDVRGKKVHSENRVNVDTQLLHSLDLSDLKNGMYVLQIKNKQTAYSKRFVINK